MKFPLLLLNRTISLVLLGVIIFFSILSCNNYQNPGNNSGKTGDGTTRDSLKAPKNDSGPGANLLNKEIKKENDSLKKQ